MWGIIPAAGTGSRIQPLAFSKELLPVGHRMEEGELRPRAVSEYLVERMVVAGVKRICFVISPEKTDIIRYFGHGSESVHFCYTIQPCSNGLCDSVFRALPFIGSDDQIIIGLPDTVWFPKNALCRLPDNLFSFLLFPVDEPYRYDAVEIDKEKRVKKIIVKKPQEKTNLIWGAFKLTGSQFRKLFNLWNLLGCNDEYIGTLVNRFIESGEDVFGVSGGAVYVDVGTVNGYYKAMKLLDTISKSSEADSIDVKGFQEQLI